MGREEALAHVKLIGGLENEIGFYISLVLDF